MAIDLLRQVQGCIANATYPNRQVLEQGPFRVFFNTKMDVIYVNYAVPLRTSQAPSADLADLIRTFQQNNRKPRIEMAKELSPELHQGLVSAGFEKDQTLPMMACTRESFVFRTAPAIDIRLIGPEDDVRVYYWTANKAFATPLPVSDKPVIKNDADKDTGALEIAIAYVDGEAAGCACLGPNFELSGVATVPECRRRGIAAAVSSFLLQRHFKEHEIAWLAADDEAAEALYRSLGFVKVGTHESWTKQA